LILTDTAAADDVVPLASGATDLDVEPDVAVRLVAQDAVATEVLRQRLASLHVYRDDLRQENFIGRTLPVDNVLEFANGSADILSVTGAAGPIIGATYELHGWYFLQGVDYPLYAGMVGPATVMIKEVAILDDPEAATNLAG